MVGVVGEREEEVGELLQERRDTREKIELGRRLVDYDARLKELRNRTITEYLVQWKNIPKEDATLEKEENINLLEDKQN